MRLLLKPIYLICFCLLLFAEKGQAQVFDAIVDQNGNGDFISVQAALNAVPNNQAKRTLIFVKNGTYAEKVVLSSTKINVSLIGENARNVILSWDDNPTKNGMSSSDTYTFWADGAGFYAENITFRNTSGNVGQALAIKTTGDTMVFKNCRFLGFQDTYYANKRRQYNLKCYVEGATDFVYGDATAVFDSCTINCVKGGQYISAPADTKLITPLIGDRFLHGLLFTNCTITADPDVPANSYFLGRPWQPNSSSVFMYCTLGAHIKPEGWSTWGNTNHQSSFFAEYKNVRPDGSPVDLSSRVSWSYQVSDLWATKLYPLSFFLKSNNVVWDPLRITRAPAAPKNVQSAGNQLSWEAVPNALGYLVLRNETVIGYSKSNSFIITTPLAGDDVYAVKSVSVNGALSKSSAETITSLQLARKIDSNIRIFVENRLVRFSEQVNYEVFTISGRKLASGNGTEVSLGDTKNGVYLVKTISKKGKPETTKIILNH